MIHLITGIPGSGKSLLAVELILENRNSQKIRACYSNIDGLDINSLRCFHLDDVENWFNLPDGSIIIIDECQRWFRPRPNGSKVPAYISNFETHRHNGHDLVLITQHPGLIDRNVRKLVELHQHMYRPFGLKFCTVLEWNTCNESPEPSQTELTANSSKKPFNKELFKYYKSATVHTHKKRIPFKKIMIFVLSITIAIFCFSSVALSKKNAIDGSKNVTSNKTKKLSSNPLSVSLDTPSAKHKNMRIHYNGFLETNGQLYVFLEDENGKNLNYLEFTGYKKNNSNVIFFNHIKSGYENYIVKSLELSNILP